MLSPDEVDFIKSHGWDRADVSSVSGDASDRQYWRLAQEGKTALLMRWPATRFWPQTPADGYMKKFKMVDELLIKAGLSAPTIYVMDEEKKLMLLEDFGQNRMLEVLAREPSREEELYTIATDILVHLHQKIKESTPPSFMTANQDIWFFVLPQFIEHFFKLAMGKELSPQAADDWRKIWSDIFKITESYPHTLSLMDYHSPNLMVLSGRRHQVNKLGIIDFQEALMAPIMVDLSLLLFDPRRDVSPSIQQKMIRRYLAAFPTLKPETLNEGLAIFIAWKSMTLAGQFIRLAMVDGKYQYLRHISRCWQRLENALMHPTLKALKEWTDRHVPASYRGVPETLRNKIA